MPRSGRTQRRRTWSTLPCSATATTRIWRASATSAYVRLEQETDRDRTILFNSNTFRDGQYAKKALLVLEALTADDRRRLGVDYAAVIVEGAKRPAEATSILE
jgi:hypothetical protein